MKILFIAPLPPPVTGQSLISEVFAEALGKFHEPVLVNLSIGSEHDGTITSVRIREVVRVLRTVRREAMSADAIYITISETVAGNIKDVLIYLLCVGRLRRVFLHLHGGSIGKLLFSRYPIIRKINEQFIRGMGGVIVSGRSHQSIFAQMIEARRIHIVPNFAQDELFVSDEVVAAKFADRRPLRVLYLSGMIEGKGYEELADAYLHLSEKVRRCIRVDFAGRFYSESRRLAFERRIAGSDGICYHGIVDDTIKRTLFAGAHVFCLPTAMYEGLPISILEAYASGCVVVTTEQPGILDVFADSINGFVVRPRSATSIGSVLERVIGDDGALLSIAMRNLRTARDLYRAKRYASDLTEILASVCPNPPSVIDAPLSNVKHDTEISL